MTIARKQSDRERDNKGKFAVVHGAYGSRIRKKYSDKRTREGKQLRVILDAIAADLGGYETLNAGQRLLLDGLKSKLTVILQISGYADRQPRLIQRGELLPVLGKSFLAYLNSMRLTLAELYKDDGKGKGRVRDLGDYLKANYVETGKADGTK